MKILKYSACVILVISLVAFSVIGVHGYNYDLPAEFYPCDHQPVTLDGEHELYQKTRELYLYCEDVCTYYYLIIPNWSEFDMDVPQEGEPGLGYEKEQADDLVKAIEKVYLNVYLPEKNNKDFFISDASLLEYYDEIKFYSRRMEISSDELLFLINICKDEDNNGYYDADSWERFTNALDSARQAYEAKSTAGKTERYWELYFEFNRLCSHIKTPGDVDNDGSMSILDATLIQRCLAGLDSMNAARRCAACVLPDTQYGKKLYPSILDATKIQRRLAGIDDSVYSHILDERSAEFKSFYVNPIVYYEINARRFPWYYN